MSYCFLLLKYNTCIPERPSSTEHIDWLRFIKYVQCRHHRSFPQKHRKAQKMSKTKVENTRKRIHLVFYNVNFGKLILSINVKMVVYILLALTDPVIRLLLTAVWFLNISLFLCRCDHLSSVPYDGRSHSRRTYSISGINCGKH